MNKVVSAVPNSPSENSFPPGNSYHPLKKYRIPLTNSILSDKEIWGDRGNQPIMLRPNDMPLYGLPVATIYDMIYRASETQDPIPFIKLGRKTLMAIGEDGP